jgi:hypothetical protein
VTVTGQEPPSPQAAHDAQAWQAVVPGSAAQILDQYIRQLKHRRRIETANVVLALLGPVLGFVVVLAFLFTAAWLIDRGHSVEGTLLGTVDIASLASVFVVGVRQRRQNNNGQDGP